MDLFAEIDKINLEVNTKEIEWSDIMRQVMGEKDIDKNRKLTAQQDSVHRQLLDLRERRTEW